MTTKTTGKRGALAAFGSKRPGPVAVENNRDQERQRRGKGDVVALTIRLSKENWKRLRHLAMDEGETLQTLTIDGYNLLLRAKGLPPLDV